MIVNYWKDAKTETIDEPTQKLDQNFAVKRPERTALSEIRGVIVHNGVFHADDVLVCALAHKVFNATIKMDNPDERLRFARLSSSEIDEKLFANPHVLIADVGGGEFDHHQRDRQTHEVDGKAVPYSACSLYLKALHDFGLDVKIFGEAKAKELMALVTEIERGDNGQPKWKFDDNFSKIVSSFNPTSLEQLDVTKGRSYEDGQKLLDLLYRNKFKEAVKFVEKMVLDRDIELTHGEHDSLMSGIVHGDDDALAYVTEVQIERERALKQCEEEMIPKIEDAYIKSKRCGVILTPEPNSAIWSKVLTEKGHDDALFVVYPSIRGGFNLQCVPPSYGSFEQRCPLDPEVCRSHGSTFVHQAKFLAAFNTLEDAVYCGLRLSLEKHMEEAISQLDKDTNIQNVLESSRDVEDILFNKMSREIFESAEDMGWKVDKRKWPGGGDDWSGSASGDFGPERCKDDFER